MKAFPEKQLSTSGRQTEPRRGVVLIVVLVLVVMVSFAGFGFLVSMTTEYEAAKIHGQLVQAEQTQASAQEMLIWLAGQSAEERISLGGVTDNPDLFRGRLLQSAPREQSIGSEAASKTSGNPWQFSVIPPRYGKNQELRFGLQDESAKLHLGTVLRWEEDETGAGRAALMKLPGMSESIADAILDWLDEDDDPREFGAESDYYQQLDKPYLPRNGIPETIDELLYVKGVTRDFLFGRSEELGSEFGDSDENEISDYRQLLTCTSAEKNLTSERTEKIDLNQSDLATLESELLEFFEQPMVRYIIFARQFGISLTETDPESNSSSGVSPDSVSYSVKTPSQFTIASPASLLDSLVTVSEGSSSKIVASPLQSSSPEFLETATLLFDRTTVSTSERVIGRINIFEAPETILKTLPEMTDEIASQILQERESIEDSERNNTAWLVSQQVVEIKKYRQWFPFITAQGDVYTGEIVVFRKTEGPFLRRKLTIDASKPLVRAVNWVNLTDQGLPVPLRLLSRMDETGEEFPPIP